VIFDRSSVTSAKKKRRDEARFETHQRTERVSPAFLNSPTSFSNSINPLRIAERMTAMR
jgi:hypothetical protein